MSQLVLTRQLCTWGNSTPLNVAAVAEHMDFMACSAPQTLLNRVWKGNMALFTQSGLVGSTATGLPHAYRLWVPC
jgi:hypothetical protein